MNHCKSDPTCSGGMLSRAAFTCVLVAATVGALFPGQRLHAQTDPCAHSGCTRLTVSTPNDPVDSEASFQVPVTVTGATDLVSFALIFEYDTTKVSLVNISRGDFLDKDGEQVRLVHSDSPMGHVVISMSRAPGASGLSGDGTLCVLNFQAVSSGTSNLTITRATVADSAHQVHAIQFESPAIAVK